MLLISKFNLIELQGSVKSFLGKALNYFPIGIGIIVVLIFIAFVFHIVEKVTKKMNAPLIKEVKKKIETSFLSIEITDKEKIIIKQIEFIVFRSINENFQYLTNLKIEFNRPNNKVSKKLDLFLKQELAPFISKWGKFDVKEGDETNTNDEEKSSFFKELERVQNEAIIFSKEIEFYKIYWKN